MLPGPLYAILPYRVDYVPYTAGHVVFYLQLLLFSGLAFFLMLGWLKRTLTITLDVDWLYRCLGRDLVQRLDRVADVAWNDATQAIGRIARALVQTLERHHGPEGVLARTWPSGMMAFWAVIVLAAYLILSYV
jgi:multicomponent Na+:H+ antiporter subunit D